MAVFDFEMKVRENLFAARPDENWEAKDESQEAHTESSL